MDLFNKTGITGLTAEYHKNMVKAAFLLKSEITLIENLGRKIYYFTLFG